MSNLKNQEDNIVRDLVKFIMGVFNLSIHYLVHFFCILTSVMEAFDVAKVLKEDKRRKTFYIILFLSS